MFETIELSAWQKAIFCSGAALAFLAVCVGSFGAHYFKGKLDPKMLEALEIGVRYLFYHALGLLIVGVVTGFVPSQALNFSAVTMFVGAVIFSGSLFILAITGVKAWGAITPIGGVLFLVSWAAFFYGILKS